MFPLQATHLQHLYLILRNDVDCKEAKQNNKKNNDLQKELFQNAHRSEAKFTCLAKDMDRSSRTRCRNTSNNMGQDARLIA
jgi:hypothetical protein